MAMRGSGWRRLVIGAPEESGAAAAPVAPAAEPCVCIERGVEMTGRLVVGRPLRIEGEFRGEIECASSVLIEPGGTVEAPIRARVVEIHGAVVGNLVASREVVIHPTGRLHGDVEAPSLVVARGAFFNGSTRMYRPERAVQSESLAVPETAPAAANLAPR
jgi:cytoskeletal protein CcmA (bactofilin family)